LEHPVSITNVPLLTFGVSWQCIVIAVCAFLNKESSFVKKKKTKNKLC